MSFAFGSPSTNTILAATDSGYVLVADTRTKRYIIVSFFMRLLIGGQEITFERVNKPVFTVNERFLARWLVENYVR